MKNLFKPILLLTIPSILILVVTFPSVLEYFMSSVCITENSQFTNEDRGTFGDMYGVLNSFLSGLSIIGIVLTLYWDKKQEVDKERKVNIDRMSYLYSVCQKANTMLKEYQLAFEKFNGELNQNPFNIPNIKVGSSTEILKVVNEKIDQEAYFHSYKSFYDDEQILNLFNHYASIEMELNHTLSNIKEILKDNPKRNKELLDSTITFKDRITERWSNYITTSFGNLVMYQINVPFNKFTDVEKSNSWKVYDLFKSSVNAYLETNNDDDFVREQWQLVTNEAKNIENNRNSIQTDLSSCYSAIQTLLDNNMIILENIKNSNHTSFKLNSFWYFFHGKPKTD